MAETQAASITVIGTITQDIVATATRLPIQGRMVIGDEYVLSVGGRGATQAIAFARMHHPVRLIGCVGNDHFGQDILSLLSTEHVTTDCVKTVTSSKTGISLSIAAAQNGHETLMIAGANSSLNALYVDSVWKLKQPQLHAISIQMDLSLELVTMAVTLAKQQQAWVILYGCPATPLPVPLIQQTDFMVLTDQEAITISGAATAEAAVKHLVQQGIARVIVTMKEQGTWYGDTAAIQHIPSHPLGTADPTGTTDAFLAAFTSKLLEEPDIAKAIRYGNAAQMLAGSRIGSHVSLPLREEVESTYRTIPV